MATYFLPPSSDRDLVLREITEVIRKPDREDAVQEAWAAHLECRCVLDAVSKFRKRESAHRQAVVAVGGSSQLDGAAAIMTGLTPAGPWDGGNR